MMVKKVAVFTGTRAEYGLLHPLMLKLKESPDFELQLIVSGMHLSPKFGETWRTIEEDGFSIDAKVEMLLASDTPCGVAKSMGVGTLGFADALDRLRPDFLVILGDRYEALAVAQVAAVMRIPIAHLHGGEITEGAYDDSIRHAITKLSHLHFVACEEYRQRVIQLGEQQDSVWNVGALGLENIRKVPRISLETINQQLGLNLSRPFFLVTYHPVTAAEEDPEETFRNLLEAVSKFPEHQVMFTYPNSDNGGDKLIGMIERYVADHSGKAWAVPSLGLARYLSAVEASVAVIGNSSSGIIEVPSLKTPAVNVGVRQKGRLSADSVLHVGTSFDDITSGIEWALTAEAEDLSRSAANPYGDGDTSRRIMEVLMQTTRPGAKVFYDLADRRKGGG